MSPRRVVGYEGEGRARRPIYHEDVIEGTPHGIPVGSPEAAAAIARVGGATRSALEIQRNDGLFPGRPALGSEEHLQQSRRKGAKRHVEVVAAARSVPPQEEVPVSEEPTNGRNNIPENIPAADPAEPDQPWLADAFVALAVRAQEARHAWTNKLQAAEVAIEADRQWEASRQALREAWRDVSGPIAGIEPTPEPSPAEVRHERLLEDLPVTIPAGSAARIVTEALLGEARASVELDEHPEAARTVKPTPLKARREAPTSGLTSNQARILEEVRAAGGDRRSVASSRGVTTAAVEQALDAIGRKGLLPVDLIALLPARFAKYATVASA